MPEQKLMDPVNDTSVPRVDNAVAVGEDLGFQERWWTFETWVWRLFALILLADVLGLFGRGWLAKAELHNPQSGMDVKYERVERASTPSILSLSFQSDVVTNGSVQLFVSNSLVKELGTQRVVPQPERSAIGNGGITYTFPVTGRTPATIDLQLEPSFTGVHTFTLQVPGKQATGGRIFVLP